MSFNLGINILEVDGRVAPSIQPAPTSVTGFVIASQRGMSGEVVRVSNWTQFVERFGSYRADANGAYAVRGFFDNGGATAYVTRVVNTAGNGAAIAASAVLQDSAGTGVLTVRAGYRGRDDFGAWGNELRVVARPNSESAALFDLIISRNGAVLETWSGLSMDGTSANYVESRLNHAESGSRYILVEATGTTNPLTQNDQGQLAPVSLIGGDNGNFADGNAEVNAYADSFALFETVPIQLLTCPERNDRSIVERALTHCESLGDRMFIGHTNATDDYAAAKAYGKAFQGTKVYGALYFPWISVRDPLGSRKWIPPVGHIAGVYARTEQERGIWKAPAGDAARLRGTLDIRYTLSEVDHTDLVKNGSVNAVRFIPGRGIIIDSSRTLSTSPIWLYVNIRLLFNFVKSSLKDGLRWTVQEPNDETLWKKIKFNTVTPFLMGLWRRGAFGSGPPEDVFTVKVDAENNPPDSRQQGILNVEVYFYPSRPAETIIITVGQQEAGASASES